MKKIIKYISIPLGLGIIVGLLTSINSEIDPVIPAWIFPVVWTVLYILMGISSYIVDKYDKISKIYYIQLGVNLLWSFIFFTFKLYLLSYIWIIILIGLVIGMIYKFYKVDKVAGLIQIPYLIWLIIASFLNLTFI